MTNKGAADYSALAKHMDTIYMAAIPTMSVLDHDRSRRFITLVDEIYDAEKKLKWTSAKDVVDLFSFITEEVSEQWYFSQWKHNILLHTILDHIDRRLLREKEKVKCWVVLTILGVTLRKATTQLHMSAFLHQLDQSIRAC